MEGWLLKSSGGKGDHRKTFGNALSKYDKRWFVLRGGNTMLYYYKAERDADRGQPPAGGVECHGCAIERVPGEQKQGGAFSSSSGFDIEFILHTADRVLNLRTNSEDTFRLWVAAIVKAGGRAPLQKGAFGMQPRSPRPTHVFPIFFVTTLIGNASVTPWTTACPTMLPR